MKFRSAITTSALAALAFTTSLSAHAGDRGIRLGPLPTAKPSETGAGAQQVQHVTPSMDKTLHSSTAARVLPKTTKKVTRTTTAVKRVPTKSTAQTGGIIVKKKDVQANAQTQDGRTPISTQTTFSGQPIIKAWLNKSGAQPQYKHGEKMQINVTAAQDCNVMIFDFDGQGKLTQLFPNDYQQNSLVRSGETISFGGAESAFEYEVFVPKGTTQSKERLFIYAYPANEAPLSVALRHDEGSPFRTGEITIEQYRKLVNDSKVYFANNGQAPRLPNAADGREVKIVAKSGQGQTKLVKNDVQPTEPNKRELSFTIVGQ